VRIPPIKGDEPLREQVRQFARAVVEGRRPLSDGWDGARVVAVMDAIDRSLRAGGSPTEPVNISSAGLGPTPLAGHESAPLTGHTPKRTSAR
jgi:hypothetical protein